MGLAVLGINLVIGGLPLLAQLVISILTGATVYLALILLQQPDLIMVVRQTTQALRSS
jgi:hypothetical protein